MKIIRPGIKRKPQQADILFIPSEITYEIFAICYEAEPKSFPLIISHTCYWWREFAFKCPILWSQISFERDISDPHVFEIYQTLLARSREAPLTIRVGASAIGRPVIKNMRKICQLIVPHVSRWKSLETGRFIPHKALRVLFDRVRDANAPLLERLWIEAAAGSRNDEDRKTRWKFRAFGGGTPRLKRMQLTRAIIHWPPPVSSFLRHLLILDRSLDSQDAILVASRIREVLLHAPGLKVLIVRSTMDRFVSDASRGPPPLTPDSFTHDSLETLTLPLHGGRVLDYILHSVRTPSVRTLGVGSAILPSSLYVLAHSNQLPSVETIQIERSGSHSSLREHERLALPLALESMVSLGQLTFSKIDLTGSNLWIPELLIWCPRLNYLYFSDCIGVEKRSLKEMIERTKDTSRAPLKLLFIKGGNGTSEDFGRLVEEGEIMNWLRRSSVENVIVR